MKKMWLQLLVASVGCNLANAQTDTAIAVSGVAVEMLFPKGKSKAVILSFDDGLAADRQLVQLMNQYQLKGTFHLNSNKLGTPNYLTRSEIKQLFKGHEVSAHAANHPFLTQLSKADVVYEMIEDRKALELLCGNLVRGMAYPFGAYNNEVIKTLNGLGLEYARTVNDTYNFQIPTDFMEWHPTIHLFGKAFSIPNNPANDQKELALFESTIQQFLQTNQLALLDVWGHSWELEGPGNKWTLAESLFKKIARQTNIWYTTQIDLVDYLHAYQHLKFSDNKQQVLNGSAVDVFIKIKQKIYAIKAGSTQVLQE